MHKCFALGAILVSAAAMLLGPQKGSADMSTVTLDSIFERKIAYTKASPFYKELHTPHLKKFLPKPWAAAKDEILLGPEWNIHAEGMDSAPGPFAVEELRTFFADAGGIKLAKGQTDKQIVLRVEGKAKDRIQADSYTLKVTKDLIEITSPTPRGALYGVYYLEQLLLDRGIPAIRPMSVVRKPVFDVRMFGEVYGTFTISGLRIDRPISRDTFSALSRFGANSTFTFVRLGDYLGKDTYPELANPDREKNIAELQKLANLAGSAGIDLYLDCYNLKLPSSHPVFKAHPEAMGAPQFGADIRCLCPSDPKTLQYIADSWADLFRRVPQLGGMVAIIGGEGFYHCYMRGGANGPDCPRCKSRPAEDVVADLTNAVFRAIRKVKPDAELFAWPYSAFVWSKEPFQLDLISKLDPGIHLVSEIDKDYIYHKNGYDKSIWDYSIDFLGPSDRYKAQAEAIRKRGLKQCCKTETATAWEHTGVPYIPCMQRWAERMGIIRAQKPDSIMYAYDCTGFTRSRPEELAGRLSWTTSGTGDEEIGKIAARDFGTDAAGKMMEAWKSFSEAMGHIPYLTHGYYIGPSFIGPGQPLMLTEEGMPEELHGRFFYLAEGDLTEGTSEATKLRPIYTADINESPAQMDDMDKALALWEQGVQTMKAAREDVPEARMTEYQREIDMAAYLQSCFRSVVNGNRFFTLRRQYRELTRDAASINANRTQALDALDKMSAIIEAEQVNARQSLIIARRMPCLDLSVRLDMDYPPLTKIIEAKLKYTEKAVKEQFAEELARLSR